MMAALILNLVLRFGGSRVTTYSWELADGPAPLQAFMERAGRGWGARAELITRVENFLEEFSVAAKDLVRSGPVSITARFDEVSLRFEIEWNGDAPVVRAGDSEDPGLGSLAILLMRHWSDQFTITTGNGDRQSLAVVLDDS